VKPLTDYTPSALESAAPAEDLPFFLVRELAPFHVKH
jgi:hypothetical protein